MFTSDSNFAQQLPVARRREDPDSEAEPEGYQPPPQVNSIHIKDLHSRAKARFLTKPRQQSDHFGVVFSVATPQPTSLGDALAAALAATTINGSSGGKKKGKRGKALLLGGPPRPML